MKILFDHKIFTNQRFGGPSRYFVNLFENLNQLKENAFILCPIYINEYLKKSEFKDKIIGYSFPGIQSSGLFIKKFNLLISNFLYKKINPDIIHTTYYDNFFIDEKKPLVITVHDLIHEIYYQEFGKAKNYRPKKKILEKASHIICVSENTKKDLLKYYNIKEDTISVVYHGSLNNEKIKLINDLKKFESEQPFFLYVGNRKRYKNFSILINAFLSSNEIYNNFKIVCFGGGKILDTEKKYLQEKKFDLNKIINFPNYNDELLYRLYKSATALIYTSSYEGFGMPILEAMSIGCPVISSNASSLPEVYGDSALNFDPLSSDELLNCISKLVKNNEIKIEFIDKGKKHSKKFTWEKCSKQTLEAYNKLI